MKSNAETTVVEAILEWARHGHRHGLVSDASLLEFETLCVLPARGRHALAGQARKRRALAASGPRHR